MTTPLPELIVSSEISDWLREVCKEPSVLERLEHLAYTESELAFDPVPMLQEGMMVEVVHGPLKHVIGRLVRKNEKARLVLSVDLIGQGVSVEVDAADVKPY